MLHYQHGDILSVGQKIVSKGFFERFGPDKCKALIKRWSFYDSPGGSKLTMTWGIYETLYYFLKKIGFLGKLELRHKILEVSSCYIMLYPFFMLITKSITKIQKKINVSKNKLPKFALLTEIFTGRNLRSY